MRRLAIILSFILAAGSAFACTDFQVKAKDGTIIIGRSMEFAFPIESVIFSRARGTKGEGGSPDGKTGLTWTSKFGYVAINAFGLEDVVVDGINEEGLSVEGLWLPGTQYQNVAKSQTAKAINIGSLGAWILGSFSKVDEVKEAVKGVRVWGSMVPQLKMEPPMHLAVHDAQGKNIVIEFIAGELKVYDNPIGVMTNSPTFDWQVTNLRNYVNLDCYNAEPLTINGLTLNPTGNGSGLLGIPGDWTPPSRFVRTVMLVHFANPAKDSPEGVNLAAHILNSVDIPHGEIKDSGEGPHIEDYTQWVVIKDLANKVLYLRDYNNLSLRCIDLKKLDFSPGSAVKSISLFTQDNGITDISDRLR